MLLNVRALLRCDVLLHHSMRNDDVTRLVARSAERDRTCGFVHIVRVHRDDRDGYGRGKGRDMNAPGRALMFGE